MDDQQGSATVGTATGLVVDHVRKSYDAAGGELLILDDVNFSLEPGGAMAVVGPSGSGKSTLLHLLGGLDRPTSGKVTVAGRDPASLSDAELADFRNETIGFVFQDHYLLPQCTVLENVLLPTLAGDGADEARREKARGLLDRVGLADRLDHRAGELSGGERQRTALARALINDPKLILADEPTGNLDEATAATIGSLFRDLYEREKVMLVVVTHSMELAGELPRRMKLVGKTLVEA